VSDSSINKTAMDIITALDSAIYSHKNRLNSSPTHIIMFIRDYQEIQKYEQFVFETVETNQASYKEYPILTTPFPMKPSVVFNNE